MEGLFNVLKDRQNVITKGLTNFKKCGKDRLTVEYIEARQELLEKDWALFKNTNTKLYEGYGEDIDQEVADVYDTTEDVYIAYKSLMKTTLNKISEPKKTVQSDVSPATFKSGNSFVKLPKISIPTFSGKYGEWTTFYDLFTSLVHKNDSLDNVQKLHYLKSHLCGEAEQLIRHTPITDANYIQCWTQLERRYSNKKYLINCILKRLFGQKRIFAESATSLKELLDTTCDCLNGLTNLEIDVSTWDVIIIHIVTFKLDNETRKQWELSVCNSDSNNDLPTFKQFKEFIENRFRALECLEPKKVAVHQVNKNNSSSNSSHAHAPKVMLTTSSSNMRCEYCSECHKLCFCKQFTKQSIEARREFVAKNKICFNCLGSNHMVNDCKKSTTCRVCRRRHHSLLHLSRDTEDTAYGTATNSTTDSVSTSANTIPIVSCLSTGKVPKRQVLLATVLIKAESLLGEYQTVRALLDQGSQACFVTEATCQLLKLKKIPIQGHISGLGDSSTTMTKHIVHLCFQSRVEPDFKLKVTAYVLNKITSYLPERTINASVDWLGVTNLRLADPEFNKPNRVDMLLGADVYSSIIRDGIMRSPSGNLLAQNTALGWVLSGVVGTENIERSTNINVMHAQINQDDILKRFWELEEKVCTKKILTPEETKCEEFYSRTTKRDNDGRYTVRLPFRDERGPCASGNSRAIAEKRFIGLERRLEKNIDLKEKYKAVIEEYLHLGHMRPVEKDEVNKKVAIYLPHHAVIREDKSTTKVRVVFNASEKNRDGLSLNDTLMVGPTLQSDLRHTVLRWRLNPIALVADIIKMYRQIKIDDNDARFQRILWRDSPEKDIQDYELVTVTFGTASAPYQAVRTLHQVVYDEGEKYPLACDRVLNCFYMDDLMTGCQNVEMGMELYRQITELLGKGGFKLQKWNSNCKTIVNKISAMEGHTEIQDKEHNKVEQIEQKQVEIKLDETIKILGLTWNRSEDTFQYSVNLPPPTTAPATKRSIISDIARLFDPLGWLAPSVVLAKVFIQKLWLTGVSWDEELGIDLVNEWQEYRKELLLLTGVRIPRWLGTKTDDDLELHGFSDASKTAYSAVIYLRITDAEGKIHVSLLVAKTRVAPVKQISIPRLELCGAVLLSQLLNETAEVLHISKDKIKAWTDSTVVLAWINSHPSRWKTFVANRTSEILNTMPSSQWFHVPTKTNPADCASRGIPPSLLVNNSLWFTGPPFLRKETIIYNRPNYGNVVSEEAAKVHVAVVPDCSIFENYSTLSRLIRIIAYCRRFLRRNKMNCQRYLQKVELDAALQCCIRQTQKELFTKEYEQLEDNKYLQSKSSSLKSLCPFLDENGIMRARGRLDKAQLSEQTKHPIILPHSSHLTRLIIAHAHGATLHGGPQLMITYLRTAYWVIGVRNLVKQHVRRCVTCAKQRATVKNQLMGSLPTVRCTPARPFMHSGVDYAGPINIRTSKGRGHHSYKGYICLFVCMATRALHLEAVSDMSSQAFLAAFRRFVARRGHCSKLWSDNGTTFVGVSRELQQLVAVQPSIAEHLEANGTEWHFIPPHSPNFGGLWEAGVKSTKYHLKRVIGDATLTYEEISTLLSQVEACLNSRPLSVIVSTEPGEPLPLTPGHFLIGESLVNVPDNRYEASNINYLTRWQFVQRMLQSFWKRWSQEYLSNLMNRYKWSSQVPEPMIGDVVLIKEDDLPPSRWMMGRVLEKHPGDDNITRVVTVRTKSSIIKRPTSKICILPVNE